MTKVLTWNIRHGGGARANAICDALTAHAPDIAVLTEFRDNRPGVTIRADLADAGLAHQKWPDVSPSTNSVLVASRAAFDVRDVPGLGAQSHRAVWARFRTLDVVGLYFPNKHAKPPVFEAVCQLDSRLIRTHSILVGDFNTGRHLLDEEGKTLIAAEYFDTLAEIGWIDSWRNRNGTRREASWVSSAGNGFRLDHAFLSPSLDMKVEAVQYSHAEREAGLSDHSILTVTVDHALEDEVSTPES